MRIRALTSWNRHIPGESILRVEPGHILDLPDAIGKAVVKQGWAEVRP